MRKLFCIICDKCKIVLGIDEIVKFTTKGKKRDLHYCSNDCMIKHRSGNLNRGESNEK